MAVTPAGTVGAGKADSSESHLSDAPRSRAILRLTDGPSEYAKMSLSYSVHDQVKSASKTARSLKTFLESLREDVNLIIMFESVSKNVI